MADGRPRVDHVTQRGRPTCAGADTCYVRAVYSGSGRLAYARASQPTMSERPPIGVVGPSTLRSEWPAGSRQSA